MAAVAALLAVVALPGVAQERPANPYRTNPADEDWTFLKTAPKTDRWDPLKYIPLGPEDWSLTLSGELRLRPEGFRVRETADRDSVRDNYLLQRYLAGADLRMGRNFRVFGEVQSGIINGSLRSPRPTDANSFDLHQAFVEWRQPAGGGELKVAAGRQEMEIGSSRLISASPGLNVKRSFDGASVAYRRESWVIAVGAAQLVGLSAGAFDDRADPGQKFWGVAAARRGTLLIRSEMGGYYLGIERHRSVYVQGIGSEVRHTAGMKWAGGNTRFDLNYDMVFQWGEFAGAPVRGWAFATETGFRWPRAVWRPRVSVRSDAASGDEDPGDPRLQSFNPLFPGNSYSGAVGLLGPTNLTDFTPAVTVFPHRTLVLGFEAPSYWRTSTADGVYATDLRVLVPARAGTGRYIGTNPGVVVVWRATPHLEVQGAITRFLSGGFLADTFVASGFGFYSATARYRF
jgi:hypothetical protein